MEITETFYFQLFILTLPASYNWGGGEGKEDTRRKLSYAKFIFYVVVVFESTFWILYTEYRRRVTYAKRTFEKTGSTMKTTTKKKWDKKRSRKKKKETAEFRWLRFNSKRNIVSCPSFYVSDPKVTTIYGFFLLSFNNEIWHFFLLPTYNLCKIFLGSMVNTFFCRPFAIVLVHIRAFSFTNFWLHIAPMMKKT